MKLKFSFTLLFLALVNSSNAQNENQLERTAPKPEQVTSNSALSAPIQALHDLTIYPNLPNMVKNVIFMDPLANELLCKVEFYAVKSLEVDDCNKHSLFGDFEVKTLEGYGYPYYVFNTNSQVISTKMGCGNTIKKVKNVASGKTETVRYMSLLPIVIYTPIEIDVKYKIWKQDPNELDARRF
jgi:ecotin